MKKIKSVLISLSSALRTAFLEWPGDRKGFLTISCSFFFSSKNYNYQKSLAKQVHWFNKRDPITLQQREKGRRLWMLAVLAGCDTKYTMQIECSSLLDLLLTSFELFHYYFLDWSLEFNFSCSATCSGAFF